MRWIFVTLCLKRGSLKPRLVNRTGSSGLEDLFQILLKRTQCIFQAYFPRTVNFQHIPLVSTTPDHLPFPSVLHVITAFNSAVLWKYTSHFPVLFLHNYPSSLHSNVPMNIFNFIEELIISSVFTHNIAHYNTILFVYLCLFWDYTHWRKRPSYLLFCLSLQLAPAWRRCSKKYLYIGQ